MFDTLIQVNVGSSSEEGATERTFEVFKGVLCFYSGYFATCLNGRWKEAEDQVGPLPDEEPLIFDLFVNWIHTRLFYDSTLEPHVLMDFAALAKLWVFGDAHDIPMLQNEVVDITLRKIRKSKTVFTRDAIEYIYDKTVEFSMLRTLLCDVLFSLFPETKALVDWRVALRIDVSKAISEAEAIRRQDWFCQRCEGEKSRRLFSGPEWRCAFHVHEEGVVCCTLKKGNGGEKKSSSNLVMKNRNLEDHI